MEKPAKSKKNMILKLLPKAAAATVIFQNPPFSPGREKRYHHNHKGFSGPIVSIIPVEARRSKSNNETNQEPTSPKVSCIGQIKKKKKVMKTPKPVDKKTSVSSISTKKKPRSNFRKIFTRARKSDVTTHDDNISSVSNKAAPCLSHMKRVASGREGTLSNFDWKNVQVTPEDHRKYYSDDDISGYDDEHEEVIIPFSAPILVGRDRPNFPLEPKKEINLWKRRTMTKPNPLQLKE